MAAHTASLIRAESPHPALQLRISSTLFFFLCARRAVSNRCSRDKDIAHTKKTPFRWHAANTDYREHLDIKVITCWAIISSPTEMHKEKENKDCDDIFLLIIKNRIRAQLKSIRLQPLHFHIPFEVNKIWQENIIVHPSEFSRWDHYWSCW